MLDASLQAPPPTVHEVDDVMLPPREMSSQHGAVVVCPSHRDVEPSSEGLILQRVELQCLQHVEA